MPNHYKTELALKYELGELKSIGGSGGPEIGYTINLTKKESITIPYEAYEFLDMAAKLVHKANKLIENDSRDVNKTLIKG